MSSFLYHCLDFYRTWLYISLTRWVSYKKQELREHLNAPPVFWCGPCCLSIYFFCVLLLCVYVLSFLLWCLLWFPLKNDVRFIFTLFFFVLCTHCYQFLWIVHSWLPLWYSLTFNYNFPTYLRKFRNNIKSDIIIAN